MTPGFTTIDNDSVIARLPEIGGSAAMVFLVLAHRANGARECWPSLATIGKETRLKRRTVQYAITRLVELDLIAVEQQQGKPTTYCLTRAPSCTPTEPGECTGMHPPVHLRAPTRAPTCTLTRNKNNNQEQQPGTRPSAARPRWLWWRSRKSWIARNSKRPGRNGSNIGARSKSRRHLPPSVRLWQR